MASWNTGLCGCFSNCADCSEAFVLPWCHLSYLTTNVVRSMAGDMVSQFEGPNSPNKQQRITADNPIEICCQTIICFPCMSFTLRTATLAAFGLELSPWECCIGCCLSPLSNAQVSRELIHRKKHAGSCCVKDSQETAEPTAPVPMNAA